MSKAEKRMSKGSGKKGNPTLDTLEAYKALDRFAPPSGSFDPLGAWENTYSIWMFRQKSLVVSPNYLQIKRTPSDAGTTVTFDVKMAVTQTQDYGHPAMFPPSAQHTEARMVCAADALSTPRSWHLVSWLADPAGKPLAYSRVEEDGVVKGEKIIRKAENRTLTMPIPLPFTSNWSLFDAVQRLAPDPSSAQSFCLLEDLDLVKPGQHLVFREKGQLEFGGKTLALTGYDQIGRGILPYQYWVDERKRLLIAISGIKVFVFNAEAVKQFSEKNEAVKGATPDDTDKSQE